MAEFKKYFKTPRLFRDVTITEKIDGTNSGVHIEEAGEHVPDGSTTVIVDGVAYRVTAQSRNRIILPSAYSGDKGSDNYGFALWVWTNAGHLVRSLGVGSHFGEWWGQGVARRYGMDRKVYSLFDTRHELDESDEAIGLRTVPILFQGVFCEEDVHFALAQLGLVGSLAAPGFMNPEGIVIRHSQSGQVYKALLENDEISKTEAAA